MGHVILGRILYIIVQREKFEIFFTFAGYPDYTFFEVRRKPNRDDDSTKKVKRQKIASQWTCDIISPQKYFVP